MPHLGTNDQRLRLAAVLLAVGCRVHGVAELPAADDPATPDAPAVPWTDLPDHLHGDVYRGPHQASPGTHDHGAHRHAAPQPPAQAPAESVDHHHPPEDGDEP